MPWSSGMNCMIKGTQEPNIAEKKHTKNMAGGADKGTGVKLGARVSEKCKPYDFIYISKH